MEAKELTDIELVGRYLCKAYFCGEILPSEWYRECAEKDISKCVERAVRNEKGGDTVWLSLMSGDLAKLSSNQRAGLLGVGVFPGLHSIDGREELLRLSEVALYASVGKEFLKLVR